MFLSPAYILAFLLVLTLHEAAHAWVAWRLGDPTAYRAGRVSLNPLRHLDPLGTLLLFFAGFGWGKPVPVNPRNFKNPKVGEALTSLAGPGMNLLLAVLAAIPFTYLPEGLGFLRSLSQATMELSLILCFFNLLPFPPLDGAAFWGLLVPFSWREDYYEAIAKATPYFVALMIADLYLSPQLFGASLVWTVVSTLTFWAKTAILILV